MSAFSLIPFAAAQFPHIEICGNIERIAKRLSIRYLVTGDLDVVKIPAPIHDPARAHELWKTTCFEFFLAIPDQPRYWEFNLSPSGNWNVYVMDAYRQINMREERSFTALPFSFHQTTGSCELDLSVRLNDLIPDGGKIQAGIAAIIQTADDRESYWALAHPGAQADFHLRDGFILEL